MHPFRGWNIKQTWRDVICCLWTTKNFLTNSCVIFQEAYYQGSNSLVHLYRLLFPTILKLAGDEDRVIKDLVKFQRIFLYNSHFQDASLKYHFIIRIKILISIFEGKITAVWIDTNLTLFCINIWKLSR